MRSPEEILAVLIECRQQLQVHLGELMQERALRIRELHAIEVLLQSAPIEAEPGAQEMQRLLTWPPTDKGEDELGP